MNTKCWLTLGICCGSLWLTGCVSTVDGKHTAAVPFVGDKVVARYPRPLDQVFVAAKEVLAYNGSVYVENVIGRTLEAKVDDRTVWVRCEAIDANMTEVTTQVRTKMGGTDKPLTAFLDKQIAVRLAAGKMPPPLAK